jgi:hypothetical protein
MTAPPPAPVRVYLSYSHKDQELVELLLSHLSVLEANGLVSLFYDRKLLRGADFEVELFRELARSQMFLVCVSADALASNWIVREIGAAQAMIASQGLFLVPIILRPCVWQSSPLGRFQALPRGGRPVVSWTNADEAFANVVQGIRQVAESLLERSQTVEAAATAASPLFAGDGHKGAVTTVKVAPGNIAFSCGGDGRVIAWDIASRRQVDQTSIGKATSELVVSPDRTLAAIGVGNQLVTWAPPQPLARLETPVKADLVAVAFVRSSTTAIAMGMNQTFTEISLTRGAAAKVVTGSPDTRAIAVLPDQKRLVLVDGSNLILMTLDQGSFATLHNGDARIRYLSLTPDGATALVISKPDAVRAIDLSSGEPQLTLADEGVIAAEPLRDGRAVVTASAAGTLKIWDLKTGTQLRGLTVDPPPTCVAVTPDGRFAVCGTTSGGLTITDVTVSATRLKLPAGADRLELYYLAVLERPELFQALIDRDDAALQVALERFPGADDGTALAQLRSRHPNVELPGLWAAWMQTVHASKLGNPSTAG